MAEKKNGDIILFLTSRDLDEKNNSSLILLNSKGEQYFEKKFTLKCFITKIFETKDSGFIITSSSEIGENFFYIEKLDSKGNSVWKKNYGSKRSNLVDTAPTSDGGAILLSYTKDFGALYIDALIVKVDSNGESGPTPKRIPPK